jgi:hypothetical protein
MAKKVEATFIATVVKNTEKGGAWLAEVSIEHEGLDKSVFNSYSAWSNAGGAKRWAKAMLQNNTPRKSVKFVEGEAKDEKGKPTLFTGTLSYKADA